MQQSGVYHHQSKRTVFSLDLTSVTIVFSLVVMNSIAKGNQSFNKKAVFSRWEKSKRKNESMVGINYRCV